MARHTHPSTVPPGARRVADNEEGTWQRVDGSDAFAPEFAGATMTLAENIDYFGPVTVLDAHDGTR